MGTLQFYKEHADDLIEKYNQADMTSLHQLISQHIQEGDNALDIGIGSGRELAFLRTAGCRIWGIDPTYNFIENAKKNFSDIQNHFFVSSLPKLHLEKQLNNFFDIIISVAVWMHLKRDDYKEAVENIIALLKPTGKIIISFSIGTRAVEDGRFFEKVDIEYLLLLFKEHDMYVLEQKNSDDGLGRVNNLTWETIVLSRLK